MNYEEYAKVMKALLDPNQVKIVDLVSCGALCAYDVLEHFDFSQPTLSQHIKVLVEAELVSTAKQGVWHIYSINEKNADALYQKKRNLFSYSKSCACITSEEQENSMDNEEMNFSKTKLFID